VGVPHPPADQADLYVLGALSATERADFEAHLALCAACAAEVRALMPVADALGSLGSDGPPPAAARGRLMAAVGRDRARTPAAAWLALAAALVVAAGSAIAAVQLRARTTGLEQAVRDAVARAEISERRAADMRRAVDRSASMLAVMLAPDVARVELAGQPAAPSASARAYWSRARGLVIHAANLPPLPAGRTYQLWVLTSQPAPISAGLLKPDDTGAASGVFDTPPDIPTPTAMAVTIEPEGGVPSPTGDKYLVGVAHEVAAGRRVRS